MEISKQSGKVKVEKAYKKMTESDAPDLWAKIESNLPEKEVRTEKKVRTGFFAKLGKIFSGGSTWKTSAAVCAVCIILLGTAQGAGGMFRAGSSYETASASIKKQLWHGCLFSGRSRSLFSRG